MTTSHGPLTAAGTAAAPTAATAARARTLVGPWPRLATAVVAGWLAVCVAVALERPAYLLETAGLGLALATAWLGLAWVPLSRSRLAVLAVLFATPLVATWPGRRLAGELDAQPALLAALLSPSSLLLAVAWLACARERVAMHVPRLLAAAALAAVLGGVTAGLGAADPAAALGDAWLAIAVPIGAALLVARARLSGVDAWRALHVLLAAACVPLVVAVAAYLTTFGLPGGGADLQQARAELFRSGLVQELVLGNVSNLGSFCAALLPVAIVAAACTTAGRLGRAVSAAAAACSGLVLLLVLTRAAFVMAVLAVVLVAALFALQGRRRHALAAAGCALALVLPVLASAPLRDVYGLAAPAQPAAAAGPIRLAATAVSLPPLAGDSVDVRRAAIERGLEVGRDHLPWGVGSGQYPRYDPVQTATHSLPVTLLAETGLLGVTAFVLLCIAVALALWRLPLRRPPTSDDDVRLAAGSGAALLLVLGAAAGLPLALDDVNVWPLLLWILTAMLVTVRPGREPERPRP
jgi:hypothetical protein